MQCPYCYGAVHDEASRCPHCGSEIAVFHPLLRRLNELQARLEVLEASLAQGREAPTAQPGPPPPPPPDTEPQPAASTRSLLLWAAGTVALLGALHVLLLFVLDASPLLLRTATLVVPLVAGALALRQGSARGWVRLLLSVAVGLSAVALMLGITAVLDGVSFWPVDAREWRETLEYTLGVTLAYLGGGLVRAAWHRARFWRRTARPAASPAPLTGWRAVAARWLERVRQVASIVAPVATCITAFYSGLRSFLGL